MLNVTISSYIILQLLFIVLNFTPNISMAMSVSHSSDTTAHTALHSLLPAHTHSGHCLAQTLISDVQLISHSPYQPPPHLRLNKVLKRLTAMYCLLLLRSTSGEELFNSSTQTNASVVFCCCLACLSLAWIFPVPMPSFSTILTFVPSHTIMPRNSVIGWRSSKIWTFSGLSWKTILQCCSKIFVTY